MQKVSVAYVNVDLLDEKNMQSRITIIPPEGYIPTNRYLKISSISSMLLQCTVKIMFSLDNYFG